MDENGQADDFDDFFDTPGRSLHGSTEKDVKSDQAGASKQSPDRSAKKRDRNGSGSVDRSSMSSDHDANPDYSSDSVSESDSDSRSRKRRKSKSRSRSASSRSGGSYSSDSSRSYSSDDSRTRSSRKEGGRRSRSRSSSSNTSRSRTATPDSRGYKEKSKSKRRDSYSSVTSSSTYSESKDGRKRSPSPRPNEGVRRQAWGTEAKSSNSRQDRPKTAKRRSSDEKPGGDASRRRGHNERHSAADSDSDMTDVSPILSPRNGALNGHGRDLGDKYRGFKPAVYQAVEDSGRNITDGGDNNALDLDILMKAVSELEKQKRVKANTRRVMFEPLRARPMDKSNYTFSNDDTHRIDQENKRLLRQIVRQMHTAKERRPRATDLRVKQSTLTASAVNRRRDQQRIENENLVRILLSFY